MMKAVIHTTIFMLLSFVAIAQEQITIVELEPVLNATWEGTLTYKNYGDGRLVSIPTKLTLQKKNERTIKYIQEYPNEPKANSTGKWKIEDDGATFNDATVIAKNKKEDGSLEFLTRYEGKDNGKASTMFVTYRISKNKLSYTKEVQYQGATERFVRNKYEYTKQ